MKKSTILIIAFLSSTALLFSQNFAINELERKLIKEPQNIELLKQLGASYFFSAGKGNKEAVEKGVQTYQKLFKIDSSDVLAIAHYGCLLTMKARDSFFPWSKMKWTKKGIVQIDKAVNMAPENIQVRSIRATTYTNFPAMFKKLETALKDFNFILRKEKDCSDEFKLNFYYYYGVALNKNKNIVEAKKNLAENN